MPPSIVHDDQLSLTLAFFANLKHCSSLSIKLLLHSNFYLGLVHTEEEQTHFQVTTPYFKAKKDHLILVWAL
jgi:hypothetical protein